MATIPQHLSRILRPSKPAAQHAMGMFNPAQYLRSRYKSTFDVKSMIKSAQNNTSMVKCNQQYLEIGDQNAHIAGLTPDETRIAHLYHTQDLIERGFESETADSTEDTEFEGETPDITEDACNFVTSTSVAAFNDLYGGAHIRLRRHSVYAHHAIVTGLNVNTQEFTVIGYKRKIRGRAANVIEETIKYPINGSVLLFNYEDNEVNSLVPQFRRLPHRASVSIVEYFKTNPAALQSCSGLQNCQNFAVTCALGYDFSLKQVNQIIIAFKALKMINKRAMDDLAEYLITRKVVEYHEGDSNVLLNLQSGNEVNIQF